MPPCEVGARRAATSERSFALFKGEDADDTEPTGRDAPRPCVRHRSSSGVSTNDRSMPRRAALERETANVPTAGTVPCFSRLFSVSAAGLISHPHVWGSTLLSLLSSYTGTVGRCRRRCRVPNAMVTYCQPTFLGFSALCPDGGIRVTRLPW